MTSEAISKHPIVFNIKEILNILPHRYPFLLVDKVVHLDLEENLIIAQKNVTMNEHFFQVHFARYKRQLNNQWFEKSKMKFQLV